MTNFVAVDLGASSGRVLVGAWDGERFELQELHRFVNGPTQVFNHIYWDALGLWDEIKIGLAKYASRFPDPPAAIAIDTWGVDYALLDSSGYLLGNPYHYRDRRTEGAPERLFRQVSRVEVFEATGIQFMQLNTLFQLYSMVEEDHPQLKAASTLLMMPDLFNYWLTGRKAAEYTIASTTQMLDARTRCWSTDLLTRLGIRKAILTEIVPPGSVLGTVLPEVARATGLPEGTPIIAVGSHDTASAVAGIPGLDENSAYISSGTWSLMGLETRVPVINSETLRLNITNEGGVGGTIRLLKNITGLWLLQECRRAWGRQVQEYQWSELVTFAEQSEPWRSLVDPDAPSFMNPPDMPAAIRAFCRRTGQPEPETPGAVVRCCLESLALKYRLVLGMLSGLTGKEIRTIRVVGGGCQNRILCQLTADACGRSVVTGPVEATALGNIMVQAIATEHIPSLHEGREAIAASVKQERFTPRPGDWDVAARRFAEICS
jgi:rhamnulokinase